MYDLAYLNNFAAFVYHYEVIGVPNDRYAVLYPENRASQDVERIATAITMIDGDMNSCLAATKSREILPMKSWLLRRKKYRDRYQPKRLQTLRQQINSNRGFIQISVRETYCGHHADSILRAHFWAVDMNIVKNYLTDVSESEWLEMSPDDFVEWLEVLKELQKDGRK